jgi:uncharacterized membrane protein
MIYAGVTFKSTLQFITKANLNENEIKEIATKNHKDLDDKVKVTLIGIVLFALIVSATKILFYPVFFAMKFNKK